MKTRLKKRNLTSNEKVTSMLTNCYVCNEKTTKHNHYDGAYLCNKCSQLSSEELFTKVVDATRDDLINDPILEDKEVFKSLLKDEN